MALLSKKTTIPAENDALPGRSTPIPLSGKHFVNGSRIKQPATGGLEEAVFGLGCFWGAERKFWQIPGVVTTAVGYAGGYTPNATYEEVCSGRTGHTEVIRVIYDPNKVSYETLLKAFWESHDPTQGMRQGGDVGTQYRSAIFYRSPEQKATAEQTIAALNQAKVWDDPIVTELAPAPTFYVAEDYHQEYFENNGGQPYCRAVVAPKVAKFRKQYFDKLKK